MKKVLLFGGTGNLGKEIAKELNRKEYETTAVVRNAEKAKTLSGIVNNCIIADVTDPSSLKDICVGFDIIVSALGKSVSLSDKSKPGFVEVDLVANSNILNEAINAGVKKFVYVSALHSERYPHLVYFKVHHDFSELLKRSGIDYSIIKPPAIFSAFGDLIAMAKKGRLINMGDGSKQTNPIYEGDLAKVCVGAINGTNATIHAGGKETYTRKQINEIVQQAVNPGKKLMTIPMGLMKMGLPLMQLAGANTYNKFAFFIEVMQHDTIAPKIGEMKFEEYVRMKISGQ